MTTVEVKIPGYLTGTWSIDPVHSYVGFVIRHAMIAKVRGQFETVSGKIVTAEDITDSRVEVAIDAASFHTNNETRNEHIRSAEFLDVEHFPTIEFTSKEIRVEEGFAIDGDLTIHGVTRPTTLQASVPQFGPNQEGAPSIGVSAHTVINRTSFGVDFNVPMTGGGFFLGNDVEVILEIEANLTS